MFRKLIVSNRFFVRGSRDLFKNNTTTSPSSSSSGQTSTHPFPYKFGGIENYPSHELNIEIFGRENKVEFSRLYGQLLDSIEKKDKTFLNERVQNRLIEPLLSGSAKQINRQSPFEFLFFTLSIGIGTKFESGDEKAMKMVEKNNIIMYAGDPSESSQMMKYMREGIPVLLSYNMAVKSSRKLVPVSGQNEKKGSEVHLLTMQQQNKLQFSKIMSIMANPNNSNDHLQKMRKVILESKQPWKIGNVDEFLPKRY